MSESGPDLVDFLEAAADVVEAERQRALAEERSESASARALGLARNITRDWKLTDEDAVRAAWRKALEEVG